jgi:hypothetical protein
MDANTFASLVAVGAAFITAVGVVVTLRPWQYRKERAPKPPRSRSLSVSDLAAQWSITVHYGIVNFLVLAGLVLVFAPDYLFSPAWFYFRNIPHGGFGMGVCCLGLAVVMIVGLLRKDKRLISWVLYLGGTAFWVAAFLIAVQGIMGHHACMEAVFMAYCSGDMFVQAGALRQ